MSGIGQGSACEFDDFGSGSVAREFWGFVQRIRESGLPAHVRHTALEIWLHMRPGKMWSHPSVARLARHTGLSERTIQSDIKKLNEAGILEVEFSKGGRAQSHTFMAKRIEQTAQELLGIIDQNPEPAAGYKAETQNDAHRFDGQKPRTRRTVKRKTPQLTTENPAGRAPEASIEAVRGESQTPTEESSLRSDSPPAAPDGELPLGDDMTPERRIWGRGAEWLARKTGKSDRDVKRMIGKWAKVVTYAELLAAFESCHAAGADPIPYISAIVYRAEKVAMEKCRRENGRLVVVNGFRQELETLLAGRDLERSLDRINGNIRQHVVGPELEAKVRSEIIKLVDVDESWKARSKSGASGSNYSLSGNYVGEGVW